MTVPGFKPVRSRKRQTSSSESGFISKEVQSKRLMSMKDLRKADKFDMLAEHPHAVTANNDDDDGEDAEESADIDEDSRTISSSHNPLGKTPAAASLPSPHSRDRTPGNSLFLGNISDLPPDAEPQIDDQQAIRIIRGRGVKKMLRNASGPNCFTKKGELYADVRYVTDMKGKDGKILLVEAWRKSAMDTCSKVPFPLLPYWCQANALCWRHL
ncbi:hypothetical protein LTR17_025688 [Elasticomyces elasticus]|nr:hypothetical protein LTR17_025688 [Elasticomyces elasticus]